MKTNQIAWLSSVIMLAIILGWPFKGAAQTTQYVTLQSGGSFQVQTNQLVSVIGFDWYESQIVPYVNVHGQLSNGSVITLTPSLFPNTANNLSVSAQIPQIATGLTSFSVSGNSSGWATFKIETPCTATVVSNY